MLWKAVEDLTHSNLTRKTTQWAVSVFGEWCDARSVKDATENMAIEVLVDLLPRFVMEACCQDETPYPLATLMQLVAGIQHHFRKNGQPSLAIFCDKDPRFARTRGALDTRMKQLTKEGVGTETKQVHRNKKRNCGVLAFFSLCTGWGLPNIVIWYNWKLPDFGERSVVDVYNHYFGFVPKTGPFYRQPIGDDLPKFSKQVVGRTSLGGW